MTTDPFSTADGSTHSTVVLSCEPAHLPGWASSHSPAVRRIPVCPVRPGTPADRPIHRPPVVRHAETPSPTEKADTPPDTDAEDGASDEPDGETTEAANSWYVRPDGGPQRIPSNWVCDDEAAERQPQLCDEGALSWGDNPGRHWELRVDDVEFDQGASVHVRLRNVSDEERGTGHPDGYNLQFRTDDGWEDVRVWRDGQPKPHPDEDVVHDPGEGFDWQFDATEAAFDDREIEVCPGLETVRYRFAFEYTDDEGIAVGFDLRVP